MLKRMFRNFLAVLPLLLAACAPAAPSATLQPPSATPPLATATPPPFTPTAPDAAPTAAALSPVPRYRTLVLGWVLDPTLVGVTNPLESQLRP